MFDYLLSEEAIKFREEIRRFVKSIPQQIILDMDADKIRFPLRDCEKDAPESDAADEKIYE
ncbi:MAG: hypothetical protein ABIJ52_05195 [Pseudomonadota bacterium]|nr:hypothetical protein [Pseudomonadota bacterium]